MTSTAQSANPPGLRQLNSCTALAGAPMVTASNYDAELLSEYCAVALTSLRESI